MIYVNTVTKHGHKGQITLACIRTKFGQLLRDQHKPPLNINTSDYAIILEQKAGILATKFGQVHTPNMKTIIKKLPNRKTPGPDGIHNIAIILLTCIAFILLTCKQNIYDNEYNFKLLVFINLKHQASRLEYLVEDHVKILV